LERQRIKDEIGALEERLELLDQIVHSLDCSSRAGLEGGGPYPGRMAREALDSLRRLQGLVQEEKFERSIEAEDFLRRVTSILVRESQSAGFEIAISTYGTGRISLEMVEVSMGAILACLRASLKSFKGMGRALRVKNRLFYTFSVYLEVRATPDEVHFRLLDDGQGYNGSFRTEFETEHQFRRIRNHISRFGGWFRRKSLAGYGGNIEFKAALPLSRFDSFLLKSGNTEVLLPHGCVIEVAKNESLPGARVAFLDESAGLTLESPAGMNTTAVKVAVADFQFWIVCESATVVPKTRRISGEGLIDRSAWFQGFGVFHEGAAPRVAPLLEGEMLMNFHVESWGADESI
jgi:hypothetical protein